ncbi:dynein regulatory complex protein 12 [Chanos chanos]|uniref:Dynein regulatory complex protein 12 n=1 Tax=Chanos chanos TaxID=29144 RepID=A0A6J2VRT2_CHACN|nr:coiled-coil domain-containing protein 153 [Chanos chanos]
MPPKKKVKGKVKQPKKSQPDQGDDLVEKYRRCVLDVATLKEHLALRTDVARRAQTLRDDLRCRIRDLEQELCQERLDMKDITADLSRQYKTMQTTMEAKVKHLETEVCRLQEELAHCQNELKMEKETHEQMERGKNAIIKDLQSRLDNMEIGYEKIFHSCLDSFLSHLAEARLKWEDESTTIHQEYKDLLTEFGLNPLYI